MPETRSTVCSNCEGKLEGKEIYLNNWCDDCLKLSQGGKSHLLERIKKFANKIRREERDYVAEELQEIQKIVYCDWGEHYVDPADIYHEDDQTTLCKKCHESILSQVRNNPKPTLIIGQD